MSEHSNLLEVRNLKLHFPVREGWGPWAKEGLVRAVDGVSFTLKSGETLGLVGESGCGKSTTARAVAQLYKPSSGEVLFKGRNLVDLSHQELKVARRQFQMIFQDPFASLDPRFTAGECIAEPLRIFKALGALDMDKSAIEDEVASLMGKVGLSPAFRNRYPHEFSGGQRQRIGIARALALKPELILADEPVSALDVSIQAQILNLLKDLQSEFNLTYLFIAHDLAVIEYISTRVAVMYLGIIAEIAPSRELYAKPLHPYTEALLSAAPIPDPVVERKRKRIILTGDVPSPTEVRSGCHFYDRCPKRMERCAWEIPKLVALEGEHQVACFLHHNEVQESLLGVPVHS